MRRREFIRLAAAAGATTITAPITAPVRAQTSPDRVLRFVPSTSLVSLDPVFSTALVAVQHGYHVFDTLYGVDGRLLPKPQMAEGHAVSDDGRTWTIRLREGLRFHDGSPVRAADCGASLERWSKRDAFGKLVAAAVDRYESTDDRTLTVRLKAPFPRLLDAIGKPHSSPAFIMPEHLARTPATTAITEIVGSGPYRFLPGEFDPGALVAYAKFDGYVPRAEPPDWTSGGKVAMFDRIEWRIIADKTTAIAALQRGEVDWIENVPADLLPLLHGSREVKVVNADPLGTIPYLRFNHATAPFNNPKLRRFVAELIPQSDYLAVVSGDGDDARECRAMFPCTLPGTEETARSIIGHLVGQPADTVAAALKATGYAGERVVVLNPADSSDISPLSQVTADLLKRAGLNVDLQDMDWGTLLQRRLSRAPSDQQGGWSIYHSTWPSIGIATPVLNTTIRGEGATGWPGWYESAEMEAQVAAWMSATDAAEMQRRAAAIDALAVRDMPSIPLGTYFPKTAYRTSLGGVLGGSVRYPWNVRRL
jgi:peptide/nickel transport system substrate-binding protein